MSQKRRKCKLANSDYADVDLRQFEQTILDVVNKTVPNKNPKVFKKYFSTDVLTQSESVSLGRALSKIENLKAMGKTVITFRLFDGKVYDCEESKEQTKKSKHKGGRMA
ncbi:MAG: hypothetical protein E7400_03760 [Ruminococcaceae bacterium]|nr:hypothetical protein [Oscillospiraceae bacterium]